MNVKFDSDFEMTINGKSVKTHGQITVINPATEDIVGHAPDCTPALLDDAVAAATQAFRHWRNVPFATRQALLAKMADTLEANIGPISAILTAEQGKTLTDAAMEIGGAAYWLRETAKMTLPETVNDESSEHRSVTKHVPLGVVGAIAPWNYPIGLSAFKLASALLAGNTVVLKPSPFTPLATLKMGEIMQTVLPKGVLNVISGADHLGPWMTSHAGFAKISFTGSTATGRKVMAGAAATLKHLTLELGGNDAAIVLPDVDVETVAKCIFWASAANNDLLTRTETILDDFFNSDKGLMDGLLSVQQIAGQLNVTAHYLSDMLRSLTGQNTQQHIHNRLIEKAKELLSNGNLSISEVAYQLGFEHPQSFNKLFKRKTKVSPLEFRQSFN